MDVLDLQEMLIGGNVVVLCLGEHSAYPESLHQTNSTPCLSHYFSILFSRCTVCVGDEYNAILQRSQFRTPVNSALLQIPKKKYSPGSRLWIRDTG